MLLPHPHPHPPRKFAKAPGPCAPVAVAALGSAWQGSCCVSPMHTSHAPATPLWHLQCNACHAHTMRACVPANLACRVARHGRQRRRRPHHRLQHHRQEPGESRQCQPAVALHARPSKGYGHLHRMTCNASCDSWLACGWPASGARRGRAEVEPDGFGAGRRGGGALRGLWHRSAAAAVAAGGGVGAWGVRQLSQQMRSPPVLTPPPPPPPPCFPAMPSTHPPTHPPALPDDRGASRTGDDTYGGG